MKELSDDELKELFGYMDGNQTNQLSRGEFRYHFFTREYLE
jgi:hypothetical protein